MAFFMIDWISDGLNSLLLTLAAFATQNFAFCGRYSSHGSAFVTSNTNFVLMNGNRATVQTAFNTPYPGPNGIGGVTVDGNSSDMKMNIDKKGNVNCSFSVQGIGISAQVFINMSSGNNTASVSISPNFSNNNLTLNGNIVPLDQSNIFKGRSW